MARILSGIQPTGTLHIGNYFGAIKQWVELQSKMESLFCVVDYHAITADFDPKKMQQKVHDAFVDYVACGIDPDKSTIFVQSHVPEHTELAWIFNTLTPVGELERMTQFKEKSDSKDSVLMGIFDYPVLMAADILIYKADTVPVGIDQQQHVELTRIIARKFNNAFGETFPEPDVVLSKGAKIMSLADPEKKMSKSHGDKTYVALRDDADTIRKKIAKAVTDTAPSGDGMSRGVQNLFGLLEITESTEERARLTAEHEVGTLKYSELKEAVSQALVETLEPIQQRITDLEGDKGAIEKLMQQGAEKAGALARETMDEVRTKIGIR